VPGFLRCSGLAIKRSDLVLVGKTRE